MLMAKNIITKLVLNWEQYFTEHSWVTTIKQGTTTLWTIAADQSADQTINIPTPSEQVQSDWNQTSSSAADYIKNKPTLWSAASKNTGTSAWNVPVLDSNGKLADSVIPAVAITDTIEVTNKSDLLSSTAQKWDVGIVTSLNKCFILSTNDPTVEANWKELKTPTDAVISVNGRTWAVTVSEFSPSGTATTWYILVKTANWYWWAENVGKVASVNSKTWAVVLNPDDLDDTSTDHKFVSSTEKSTWNGKQNALATQTAYTSKGSATKVPVISTNSLWQVTSITETTITQPSVWNGTVTVNQAWTSKWSFTMNQSSAWTIELNGNLFKTQSQYDALPSSKATDGNTYVIYDVVS